MLIPYRIAFVKVETENWKWALIIIDLIFAVDIGFCFFSTYMDDEFAEIDNHKKIIKNYFMKLD